MGALVNKAVSVGSDAPQAAQYLTFMLGSETFAIGILSVREIIEYGEVSAVPLMPACMRGVINLRGAVVPVLDLAARFGRTPGALTKRSCIVIVESCESGSAQVVGVMVDAVNAVIDIERADIEAAPGFGARLRTDFIAGLGKVGGKFVIVLDIDAVLATMEIAALAEPIGGET
jgi:purine-binding chemotaxis protein CheW